MWKLYYHLEQEQTRGCTCTFQKYRVLKEKSKTHTEYLRIIKEEKQANELEQAKRQILADKEQKQKKHWDKHKHDTPRPFYHYLSAKFTSRTSPNDDYSLPSDDLLTTPQAFFPLLEVAPLTLEKRSSVRHETPHKRNREVLEIT